MSKGKNDIHKDSKGEHRGHGHFEKGQKQGNLNESKLPDFKHTPAPPPPPPKKDGSGSKTKG